MSISVCWFGFYILLDKVKPKAKRKEEPSSIFQRQRVDALLVDLRQKFPPRFVQVIRMCYEFWFDTFLIGKSFKYNFKVLVFFISKRITPEGIVLKDLMEVMGKRNAFSIVTLFLIESIWALRSVFRSYFHP